MNMLLINNATMTIAGLFTTLEEAEDAVASLIPKDADWTVWDEENLATIPSSAEQVTLFNSVRGDAPERERRFDNKSKGATAILEAARAAHEAGTLGKPTKRTRRKANGEAKTRTPGNCARVWAICDELKASGDVVRKAVLAQAAAEGIPAATASTQYQRWRTQ